MTAATDTPTEKTPIKSTLVDITNCIGCRACQVACKQWNDKDGEPTELESALGFQNPATLSAAGFWYPSAASSSVGSPSRSFHCLHATWQARQPMHFVMSISVDLMGVAGLAGAAIGGVMRSCLDRSIALRLPGRPGPR